MAHVDPIFGSGTTNGNMVAIAQTTTPGTNLHTCVSGTDHSDEVWVWVTNTTSASLVVTLEIDGVATANKIVQTIPPQDGAHLMLPGIRMDSASTVAAFCGTAGCNAIVNVNRIVGDV